MTICQQKLIESHRIHEQRANASDSKSRNVGQDKLKQRTRRNDMQRRQILLKEPQRHDSFLTLLDFVEENQGFVSDNGDTRNSSHVDNNSIHIQILAKQLLIFRLFFKINFQVVFELDRKMSDSRRLADLPCTTKQQRLVMDIVFPFNQRLIYNSWIIDTHSSSLFPTAKISFLLKSVEIILHFLLKSAEIILRFLLKSVEIILGIHIHNHRFPPFGREWLGLGFNNESSGSRFPPARKRLGLLRVTVSYCQLPPVISGYHNNLCFFYLS